MPIDNMYTLPQWHIVISSLIASSLSVLILKNHKSLFLFFGVSVQADMQPESSGCNEVKYNLNVDTIEAIFKTYPAGNFSYILSLFCTFFFLSLFPIRKGDITYISFVR